IVVFAIGLFVEFIVIHIRDVSGGSQAIDLADRDMLAAGTGQEVLLGVGSCNFGSNHNRTIAGVVERGQVDTAILVRFTINLVAGLVGIPLGGVNLLFASPVRGI